MQLPSTAEHTAAPDAGRAIPRRHPATRRHRFCATLLIGLVLAVHGSAVAQFPIPESRSRGGPGEQRPAPEGCRDLPARIAELSRRRESLLRRYTERHPEVMEIERELGALRALADVAGHRCPEPGRRPPRVVVSEASEVTKAKAERWRPVSIATFEDSINHALVRYEGATAPYPQYAPEQIVHIAENLLAGQNADGGWAKNKDWTRVFPDTGRSKLRGRSTFDNGATWSQVEYLAKVYAQTRLKRYAQAATRGIEYMLVEQRGSGGWRGADVDAITFNDGVMAEVLGVLKDILEDRDLYAFVDPSLRRRVATSYRRGLRCVLRSQIRVGDRLTAWGQQHGHETFEPVWARSFEPPSLVTRESVGVLRLLMSIEDPPPQVIESIQSAVAWLERVQIRGLRIDRVKAKPMKLDGRWSDVDLVAVEDPEAPPIWTRYYDLVTEKPIFCTRQSKVTSRIADLGRELRTRYNWYGDWPAALLQDEYPRWQRKWAPQRDVLSRASGQIEKE